MQMKTKVAAGAFALASIAGLAVIPASSVEPGFQKTKVTEDSPVWDCHTMGNKICGSGELHAEEDAIKFLSSLSDWCAARDQAAETWVEKHDGWFEVLGRCDGAYRSGS